MWNAFVHVATHVLQFMWTFILLIVLKKDVIDDKKYDL